MSPLYQCFCLRDAGLAHIACRPGRGQGRASLPLTLTNTPGVSRPAFREDDPGWPQNILRRRPELLGGWVVAKPGYGVDTKVDRHHLGSCRRKAVINRCNPILKKSSLRPFRQNVDSYQFKSTQGEQHIAKSG